MVEGGVGKGRHSEVNGRFRMESVDTGFFTIGGESTCSVGSIETMRLTISLFIINTSTWSFATSSSDMVPSSASLIGSKGFTVDGMNDEMCAATNSKVLSVFF